MRIKSKLLSVVLTLCMVISMMPNMVFAEDNVSSKDIVIMHTNDVHSRVDEKLGYTSVKAWKDEFEQNGNDVLLLDAGDTLHGLPIANLSNGENIVKIMNEVGYDAMTAGNHDFNHGMSQLLNLKDKMKFDFLVANVTKDGVNSFTTSKVYEKGNKKIGVVGLATPESATKTNPLNVAGYSFNEDKLAKLLQDEINSLQGQGVDYIVTLGHLGVDTESSPYMSTEIISQVEGLDIFIDGHSHTEYENGINVKDKDGEDVLLVQAGSYLSNIGKIVIKEDGQIEASLIKEKKSDEKIDSMIATMKSEIQPLLDRVVGKTSVFLDGERDPGVRTKETNLGNLVTDSLKYVSGADVAIMNGGGIRTSVELGDITYGELNAVLPFGNIVTKIEVTGDQIVKALEHGTASAPAASGAFPQVSGITYEIHTYLNENRVQNVKINGETIDLNKTYTLAVNDFMAVGGDGYEMFKTAKKVGEYSALDEALVNFIKQLPNSTVGEEYSTEQGRIAMYSEPKEEDNNGNVGGGNNESEDNDENQEEDDNGNKDEVEDTDKEENNDKEDEDQNVNDEDKEESPQTGDNNRIVLYGMMLIASSVILLTTIKNRKKVCNK